MRAEELQGHLDAVLLAALEGGPRYGYAVTETLRQDSGGRLDLPTGTIYPALRRLEQAWREFAANVSAVLEGGPCPDPA